GIALSGHPSTRRATRFGATLKTIKVCERAPNAATPAGALARFTRGEPQGAGRVVMAVALKLSEGESFVASKATKGEKHENARSSRAGHGSHRRVGGRLCANVSTALGLRRRVRDRAARRPMVGRSVHRLARAERSWRKNRRRKPRASPKTRPLPP